MTTHSPQGLTPAEQRYETNSAQLSTRLSSWRTPERRRLLVRLNWACIAIMAAIAVAGYFWLPAVLAWLPMTVAICTVWTMLRTVIDLKDGAPARFLDEFEAATLLHARSAALKVLVGISFVIGLLLIFGSSFQLGDGHRLAYSMGCFAVLAVFVGGVIPAAAMTHTMDDK